MVWSGSRPACLPLPFICLPVLFIRLPGWVLVVRFPAGLSPTFICFPLLFMCLPLPFICPPTSFHLSPSSFHCLLSPRLGACGRVPGWLVSHFLSFVSHFFSLVSQFFSSQAASGSRMSGSRLACLPLPCVCLPFPFICLPLLFICPGWLVSHFLDLSPISFNCLPVLFICLPKWMLVVGFPAGLSPTSLHLSPTFSPNSLRLGVLNSFLRCCPPFVSLLVSAHFHWPLVV